MKKNFTTIFGALMALALFASACGGGGGDQAVIDAVAAQINEDGDIPEGVDVDCMSTAMVEGLGGAEVMEEEFGLTAESIEAGAEPDDVELSVDDARSMADDMLDCGVDDIMVDQIVGEGLGEEAASCLLDEIGSDSIRDMLATEFMSSDDGNRIGEAAEAAMGEALFGAIADCNISPADLG